MRGAGWSSASLPGYSGNAAYWCVGNTTLRTSLALFSSLASLSCSGDFEIGSNHAQSIGKHSDANFLAPAGAMVERSQGRRERSWGRLEGNCSEDGPSSVLAERR